MPHKAEILQDWFARVWTDGDLAAILEFLSPDAASKGILPDVALTPDDMPHLVQLMRAQLGPIDVRLAKTMDQGDWIAALLEVRSNVRDTGDPIQVFGQIMARFEGRMMAEVYHSFDFLTYFEQMGQVPPTALAVLLAGNRLN